MAQKRYICKDYIKYAEYFDFEITKYICTLGCCSFSSMTLLKLFLKYSCYHCALLGFFFNVVFAGYATTDWTYTYIDESKRKLMPFENKCCERPFPLDQTKDESWFSYCCLNQIPGTKAEDNCNSRYRDSCTTWVAVIDQCLVGRNRETQYQCPFSCDSGATKHVFNDFYYKYTEWPGRIQYYFKECKAPYYVCDECTWGVCKKECDTKIQYMTKQCTLTEDAVCSDCPRAFPNRYLKAGVSCSPWDGGRNYLFCDQCTKTSEYDTINTSFVNCPTFNKNMGRPPGIDDSMANQRLAAKGTNYCLSCKTCVGEYKYGIPLYFAQSYEAKDLKSRVNCVTVPKAQCVFTHLTIDNKLSKEPMVFKYGMKRIPGSYTELKETLTLTNKDTLPSYVNCAANFQLKLGYRPRNETVMNQSIAIYNDYISFQSELQDCSEQYIGECDTGYYVSSRNGIQIFCDKCINADSSPGGFMEYCECPKGFANKSAIQSALLQIAPSLNVKTSTSSPSECISCLDKVFFRSDDVSERISCSMNRGIERCKPNEYIPDVDSGCQACPIGTIPKINKNECQRCEKGKYSDGVNCVPCDPSIEYCPIDGMTAPTPKNTSCPSGKLFVSTPQSNTENNRCEECPSECQGETYIVFAAGHNQSNGCSQSESERTYFTCYDPSKASTLHLDRGEKYRTIYDYDPVGKRAFITIDGCNKYRIPEHAEWVDGADNQGDKQCVFACRHGWNVLLGDELLSRIRQVVYYYPENEHLQSFLKGIENPSEYKHNGGSNTVEKKVNWPDNIKYVENDDSKWGRAMYASMELDSARGRYYKLKNTFLFVDQIMAEIQGNLTFMQGLCLSPTDAYERETGCPVGFTVAAAVDEFSNMNCALEARKGAIFSIKNPSGDSYDYVNAILTSDYNKIHCAMKSYEDSKWIPYKLCQSCLDLKYQEMDSIDNRLLSVRNKVRRKYMLIWLNRIRWQKYFLETSTKGISLPYEFIKTNCETTAARGRKFFSIQMEDDYAPGVRASLPCNLTVDGNSFCSEMFGEQYAYDISGTCAYDGSPCTKCNASTDLVPVSEANAWLKSSSGLWDRSTWPLESHVCKYRCDVNYTSNKDWKTYGVTPCIPCDNITQQFFMEGMSGCKTKGASYFNVEDAMGKCVGGVLGISEYTPQCSACSPINTPEQLVFSTERLFDSNEECLALCPPDLYRTIIFNETSQLEEETLKPVKQSFIINCTLCVDEHVIACNNSNCSEGYFRFNEAECVACNTSSCTVPGFYRTLCPQNSISDSFCAACDERELLYNNYEAAMAFRPSALLWRALNESQLARSRRWLSHDNRSVPSVFLSEEGCAVTCVNNYVWIDFSTGRPPADNLLRPHYACVPCNSDFIRVPSGTTDQALYSVWNYRGVMIPQPNPRDKTSIFAQMQKNNMTGGCYLCPPNTNTIPEVDIMCQTIPGFGISAVMGVPVGVTTRSIEAKAITLETSETFQTVFYMSKRTPVVRVSDTVYFTCCGKNDQGCKVFEKKEIDRDQSILLGSGSFYGQCTNNVTGARYARRLLEDEGIPLEKCLVGQYNHLRGSTICFDCPLGASTVEPYHGVDARGKCKCLPGYYAIRNAKEILERCVPCGFNKHRTVHMQNDTHCEACPRGKITPSETSANCYCDAGSYPENETSCILCEAGGYCESGGSRVACPENSWSAPGARSRSDCVCRKEEGFYGSLANPGSVCRKVPPTMQCEGGRCECAVGWYPVYNTSADGLVTVMRCMTECSLGHYAVIHPSTFQKLDCKPCPLNTYSSSRQSIYAGEGRPQCTPCPVNFQTTGVGSVAPSQCACLRGVKNTSTSDCGSCPPNTYLSALQGECLACPAGATSAAGSVGFSSCLCPKGSRATFGDGLQCEACPLNTYAASAGFSCTRCPKGMVTLGEGSTSLRDCACSGGRVQYAGMCV